jgi:hypothetical protein
MGAEPTNASIRRFHRLADAAQATPLSLNRSQGGATLPLMDYAGAVAVDRGRCFRFIYDEHGKPTKCPEPPIATGWLQVGPKWHQVDSCDEHSAQLRRRGPYRPPTAVSRANEN